MTKRAPSFDELFRPLIGLPCWNVKYTHGTTVLIEFGDPSLDIRDLPDRPDASPAVRKSLPRRAVDVRGQWSLFLDGCAWRIEVRGEQLAHSESNQDEIRHACFRLDGQALGRVSCPHEGWVRFDFDLGGVLTTLPYEHDVSGDADLEDAWHLRSPDGLWYTYRTDGAVSLGPSGLDGEAASGE